MSSATEKLAGACERYWAFQCEETPLTAFFAGQTMPEGALVREGPADHERRAAVAKALLKDLEDVTPASLSRRHRVRWKHCRPKRLRLRRQRSVSHRQPLSKGLNGGVRNSQQMSHRGSHLGLISRPSQSPHGFSKLSARLSTLIAVSTLPSRAP